MNWSDVNLNMELLAMYYHTRRGAGHTRALMLGAVNVPGTIVLVKDREQGEYIQRFENIRTVMFDEIEYKLRSVAAPLVIDPWALNDVWMSVRSAVLDLQRENSLLKDQIHSLNMKLERRKHGDHIVNQWRES